MPDSTQALLENGQKNDLQVLDRLYDRLRKQIEHEDGLVNHRITWLLASQGFLFFAYNQVSTAANKPGHFKITLLLIAALGLAITLSIFLSILAAFDSLKNLRASWKYSCQEHFTKQNLTFESEKARLILLGFPQLTWVGTSWVRAISSAGGLPYFFVIIWSARIVMDLPDNLLELKILVSLLAVAGLIYMYTRIKNARDEDGWETIQPPPHEAAALAKEHK